MTLGNAHTAAGTRPDRTGSRLAAAATAPRRPSWLARHAQVSLAACAAGVLIAATAPVGAQTAPATTEAPAAATTTASPPAEPAELPVSLVRPEKVEADVSTRQVAVTSSFTGVEIVVFGAISNAKPQAAEAGEYDVVVVLEGARHNVTARRKTNRAGIWINTQAVTFNDVPSFYAIASTRALDKVSDAYTLSTNDIGFSRIPMTPVGDWERTVPKDSLEEFRNAVVRLKQRDKLYLTIDDGVSFVGRNLFRVTVNLPANVPVGTLEARVHLFRDTWLIDTFQTSVVLERQGIERYMHAFAFDYPLFYGIFAVLLAALAGISASAIVQRMRS